MFAALNTLNHNRCYTSFQIKDLIFYFMPLEPLTLKSAPFDLKYGFADFLLIGLRAAPDNQVILRHAKQSAPERPLKVSKFIVSLRGKVLL